LEIGPMMEKDSFSPLDLSPIPRIEVPKKKITKRLLPIFLCYYFTIGAFTNNYTNIHKNPSSFSQFENSPLTNKVLIQ